MKKFKTVPSPFGTGIDEQASTDAFVDYVGGRQRADQLSRIQKDSYPSQDWKGNRIPASQVFRTKAKNAGFTDEEVDALLSIQ